ncbi:MAG: PAS domain-containing protein [Pseudomonadota bacterium]
MEKSVAETISAYWEKLRDGGRVPRRSAIDPRHFESALEHMFILEDAGSSPTRIRLGGLRLCELMGIEIRGMAGRCFFRHEDHAELERVFKSVMEEPATADLICAAETMDGTPLRTTIVLRPLTDEFDTVNRILGAVSFHGVPKSGLNLTLISAMVRRVGEEGPPRQALNAFAEDQTPYSAPALTPITGSGAKTKKKDARRDHLKLVVNRDD